jgi:hypothetical protein
MALVLKDRVKETTTSTGTGTITLAGAVDGYQAFSVIGDGNTTYYTIAGATEWEVGVGTYTSSGTTLSRDTVLASSNSGSLVNFSAGTKDVLVVYPAGRSVVGAGGGSAGPSPLIFNSQVVSESITVESGLNAQSVGPITVNSGVSVTVSSGQRWLVV